MLSVIDQHWREHLYEMDYLQEGINLRAMGQQDPLSEWQREGFDMFEAMMGTDRRRLRAVRLPPPGRGRRQHQSPMRNVQYSAPRTRSQGSSSIRDAGRRRARERRREQRRNEAAVPRAGGALETPIAQQPVRVEKTPGRNEPCWCGSGKKYKLCHGR